MRLPRFRARTLMLAVGIVALLLWGGMLGFRSYIYHSLPREYGRQERFWREHALRDRAIPARTRSIAALWGIEIADYYAPLVRK
jgi:hypothetical protein